MIAVFSKGCLHWICRTNYATGGINPVFFVSSPRYLYPCEVIISEGETKIVNIYLNKISPR